MKEIIIRISDKDEKIAASAIASATSRLLQEIGAESFSVEMKEQNKKPIAVIGKDRCV